MAIAATAYNLQIKFLFLEFYADLDIYRAS
jgi:hypothetical protein